MENGIKEVSISLSLSLGDKKKPFDDEMDYIEIRATATNLDDLITFFCVDCQRLGQKDVEARDRLDAAIRRVFGRDLLGEEVKSATPSSPPPSSPPAPPSPPTSSPGPAAPVAPATSAAPGPAPAAAPPLGKPAPAAQAQPAKPASNFSKEIAGKCEDCGTDVTTSEKKMSQLFASKTLCKKCLDKFK